MGRWVEKRKEVIKLKYSRSGHMAEWGLCSGTTRPEARILLPLEG